MGRAATAGLTALALFALCWPTWPPSGDLPQHAAQVAWMHRYPDAPYSELFRLNLLTPYLTGYGLAWLLSHVVSVAVAMKLLLTACLLGMVAGTRALLREAGADPDWTALTVPVWVGFAWQWGFLNYLVGLPLLLGISVLSLRQVKAPSWQRGVLLAACLVGLVPVHAYICLLAGAIGGVMALSHPRPWLRRLPLALPFTVPLPALFLWGRLTTSTETMTHQPPGWEPLLLRPLNTLAYVLGAYVDWPTLGLGLLLLLTPVLAGARPRRELWRWTPLMGLSLLLAVLPLHIFGTFFLRERLTALAFVFWLALMERRPMPRWALVAPALWLTLGAVTAVRWQASLVDARAVLGAIPRDERVLSLMVDRDGPVSPIAYLHLPQWYAVETGGLVEMSFAQYYPQVVRYRPGSDPELPAGLESLPEQLFTPALLESADWTHVVVRDDEDPATTLLSGVQATEVLHRGKWWLYRLHR